MKGPVAAELGESVSDTERGAKKSLMWVISTDDEEEDEGEWEGVVPWT